MRRFYLQDASRKLQKSCKYLNVLHGDRMVLKCVGFDLFLDKKLRSNFKPKFSREIIRHERKGYGLKR